MLWKIRPSYTCVPIEGLGSSRRILLKVSTEEEVLAVGVVFLPCGNDSSRVNLFLEELNGLCGDIEWIEQVFQLPFALLGDFNIQPTTMQGVAENRRRRAAWDTFLIRSKCVLLNLLSTSELPQTIFSLARKRTLLIRACDTHQDCHGSRILDAVLCPKGIQAHMYIHNGLHCKTAAKCC